jgi:DNA-binding CsgD family transcriptional regulator/tetratricopeptide (TPR) repeat protein
MRLLEREPSLAALAAYAGDASRGDGRLVLIAGEAGVGKSALVEQFAAGSPDARWLWGACDGLFTPRPLGPLFDLADDLGGELLALCRAQTPREDLFGALLRQISEPGPVTVVVVEDIHWADEATLDLLRFLGRRIRNGTVMIIATYRDDDLAAGDLLLTAVGELGRQPSTRRIQLAPLSAGAVADLAAASGLDAAELYRLTGGNPFYVTEAVAAGLHEVPAAARDATLARAAGLSGPAQRVLEAAALAGTRCEPGLLEAAAGCPPEAVAEAVGSGLLVDDGGELKFRHEIARLAVERSISSRLLGGIHARILAALQAAGCDDDARLAFHAEGAGDGPAVMCYAPAAARRAAELASHREAAAQYQRAIRFGSGADPVTAAGLYDGLAMESSLIDRWQDAAEAGERALALWRQAGDRLCQGATMLRLARTMWRLCRGEESAVAVESALALLEPLPPSAELARAYAQRAGQRMVNGEHELAVELARRAQLLARQLDVPSVLSDALNTEGCTVWGLGGDGTSLLRQALEIAVAANCEEQAGRAFANLHAIYCARRQFPQADVCFAEGVAYTDEHDISTYGSCLRGEHASALVQAGRWDEAAALSEEVLDRTVASPINRLNPLISLGKVRARRGEAGAWDCLDEAVRSAHGSAEPGWIAAARLARAEAHWLAGDRAAAAREAELAAGAADGCDAWDRGEIAEWLHRTGSGWPAGGGLAEPYRLQAEGHWEKAAQQWTDLGCPYEAALVRYDSADETALREALRIFTDLGAAPAAQLTRQKMRQAGLSAVPAGPRRTTRADPLGLTRREREVLDLICAGLTNADIASRLFISAKTVDHHVSAVLAKLGVPTRNAAAQAARRGLADQAETQGTRPGI